MKNQSSLPRWSSLCILAFAATMFFGFWTIATDAQANRQTGSIANIELSSASPEKQKIDAAVFPHDLHVEAIMNAGKDCAACHNINDGKANFAFRDAGKLSGDDLKDFYHESCVACHKVAQRGTPPMLASCRTCHAGTPPAYEPNVAIDFMSDLHTQHVESAGIMSTNGDDSQNCSACHHSVDENLKRIPLNETPYMSCNSCHQLGKDKAKFDQENPKLAHVPALKQISHASCASCHMEMNLEPVTCTGCHSGNSFNIPIPDSTAASAEVTSLAQALESSASK